CGSLTEVGCNDDASTNQTTSAVTNLVAAGVSYYVMAEGYGGAFGNLHFHLNFTEGPPANDQCSGAMVISSPSFTNTMQTVRATSTNDPVPSCGALSNGVWYQYTPPSNGALVVDTSGSDFNTVLAVYTGGCGALSEVACSENVGSTNTSRASLLVSSGTTYYILAGGLNGQTGNLVLHTAFSTSTLANDQCSGAIVIAGPTYTNTQSTAAATSTGEPIPSCVTNFGNGVWYRYTPQLGGGLAVDTVGSDFDTVLALYTNGCGALMEVGCNNDAGAGKTSQFTNVVTGGTTYYILAGGVGGTFGNLVLHLNFTEGPPTN